LKSALIILFIYIFSITPILAQEQPIGTGYTVSTSLICRDGTIEWIDETGASSCVDYTQPLAFFIFIIILFLLTLGRHRKGKQKESQSENEAKPTEEEHEPLASEQELERINFLR